MPPAQNPLQSLQALLSVFANNAQNPHTATDYPDTVAEDDSTRPSKSTSGASKPFQSVSYQKSRSAFRKVNIDSTDARIKKPLGKRLQRAKQSKHRSRSACPANRRSPRKTVPVVEPAHHLPAAPPSPEPHRGSLQSPRLEYDEPVEEFRLSSDNDAAFKDDIRKILENRRKDIERKVLDIDTQISKEMSLLTKQTLNKIEVLSAKEELAMTDMSDKLKGDIKNTADKLGTLSTRVKQLSDNAPRLSESVVQALSLKFDAVVAKFREDTSNIDDQFRDEKRLCEQQLQKQAAEFDHLSKVLTATVRLTRSKTI